MAVEDEPAVGRAFSIVELLVAIAMVAVLVALSSVALSAVRGSARASASLALQRQLVVALGLYQGAHAEAFPYMGTPGDPDGPVTVRGHNVRFQGYFTDQSVHWLSLIVPDFADANALELDHRERADPRGLIRSRYFLTECAFADPRLFRPAVADAEVPPTYFRATRAHEVRFPSRKGLVLDVSGGLMAGVSGGYLCAFADGAGREVPPDSFDPSRIVNQPYSNSAAPVLNTLEGLGGADLR